MRAIAAALLGLCLIAAEAGAQTSPRYPGPDHPATEAAARAAVATAEVRRLEAEVRRIEGLTGIVSGEVKSLAAAQRSLGGLETRLVGGGLEVILPGDVLFDFDKATIRPNAIPILERIGSAARQTGDRPIRIEGHTDAIGTPAYNQRLSTARAEAVSGWLVRSGIDAGRLTAQGFGAARPVAPNKTAEGADNPSGRQRNRRVTVIFRG